MNNLLQTSKLLEVKYVARLNISHGISHGVASGLRRFVCGNMVVELEIINQPININISST